MPSRCFFIGLSIFYFLQYVDNAVEIIDFCKESKQKHITCPEVVNDPELSTYRFCSSKPRKYFNFNEEQKNDIVDIINILRNRAASGKTRARFKEGFKFLPNAASMTIVGRFQN